MMRFIEQEASEKVEEIETKASEEFEIEKDERMFESLAWLSSWLWIKGLLVSLESKLLRPATLLDDNFSSRLRSIPNNNSLSCPLSCIRPIFDSI